MTYVPHHSEIVAAGRRNNLGHQALIGFGRSGCKRSAALHLADFPDGAMPLTCTLIRVSMARAHLTMKFRGRCLEVNKFGCADTLLQQFCPERNVDNHYNGCLMAPEFIRNSEETAMRQSSEACGGWADDATANIPI
jgi:hypothetical protein